MKELHFFSWISEAGDTLQELFGYREDRVPEDFWKEHYTYELTPLEAVEFAIEEHLTHEVAGPEKYINFLDQKYQRKARAKR